VLPRQWRQQLLLSFNGCKPLLGPQALLPLLLLLLLLLLLCMLRGQCRIQSCICVWLLH
jgi:hypothetical protein